MSNTLLHTFKYQFNRSMELSEIELKDLVLPLRFLAVCSYITFANYFISYDTNNLFIKPL